MRTNCCLCNTFRIFVLASLGALIAGKPALSAMQQRTNPPYRRCQVPPPPSSYAMLRFCAKSERDAAFTGSERSASISPPRPPTCGNRSDGMWLCNGAAQFLNHYSIFSKPKSLHFSPQLVSVLNAHHRASWLRCIVVVHARSRGYPPVAGNIHVAQYRPAMRCSCGACCAGSERDATSNDSQL